VAMPCACRALGVESVKSAGEGGTCRRALCHNTMELGKATMAVAQL